MSKDSSYKYYQNNKERPQKNLVIDIYLSLSKEEWYKNLPEDEKQKLVEYKKNIKWEKTPYHNYEKQLF